MISLSNPSVPIPFGTRQCPAPKTPFPVVSLVKTRLSRCPYTSRGVGDGVCLRHRKTPPCRRPSLMHPVGGLCGREGGSLCLEEFHPRLDEIVDHGRRTFRYPGRPLCGTPSHL